MIKNKQKLQRATLTNEDIIVLKEIIDKEKFVFIYSRESVKEGQYDYISRIYYKGYIIFVSSLALNQSFLLPKFLHGDTTVNHNFPLDELIKTDSHIVICEDIKEFLNATKKIEKEREKDNQSNIYSFFKKYEMNLLKTMETYDNLQ